MEIKIGNYTQFLIGPIKDNDGTTITDLALATGVAYMIKENVDDLDSAALLTKTLSSGIQVNIPTTGWVTVTINSGDTTLFTIGDKYHALKITYSTNIKKEINFVENNATTQVVTFVPGIIKA